MTAYRAVERKDGLLRLTSFRMPAYLHELRRTCMTKTASRRQHEACHKSLKVILRPNNTMSLDHVESGCDGALSDDDDFPEEVEPETKLKTGINLNDFINAREVTFEIDETPDIKQECDVSNNYFDKEEMLKYLNPYADSDSDDEDEKSDPSDDNKTPYEVLAKRMQPLTDDKGVLKKIVKEGLGCIVPQGAVVTVHYNAYQEHIDEPFDSTRLQSRPFKESLGTQAMITGLEIAIQSMKKHEVSHFLIQPNYAYGPMGCPPRIPENATILYEVELLDFLDYGAATLYNKMPEEERQQAKFEMILSASKAENLVGNDWWKKGNSGKAVIRYTKAIGLLEKCRLKNEEEEKAQQSLLLRLYLNTALCRLKLKQPVKAMTACNSALHIDSENVKALYNKGRAKIMVSDFHDARRYLLRAKRAEPINNAISAALKELDKKETTYRQNTRLWCTRIFSPDAENAKQKGSSDLVKIGKGVGAVSEDFRSALEVRLKGFCEDENLVEIPFISTLSDSEMACLLNVCKGMNLEVKKVEVDGKVKEIKIIKNWNDDDNVV